MKQQANPQPPGPELEAVHVDDEGRFTNVYSDGTKSPPTTSIEDAVVRHQRARSMGARQFLRRKRKPWLTHRI